MKQECAMERNAADEVPSLYRLTRCVVGYLVTEEVNDERASVESDFDVRRKGCFICVWRVRTLNPDRKYQRVIEDTSRAMDDISETYSDKQLLENPRTDLFLSRVYRCAYVYRYLASHAFILRSFLLNAYDCRRKPRFANHINRLIRRGDIHLCSIGGGPGTDILAFMLFLDAKFQNGFPEARATPKTSPQRSIGGHSRVDMVQSEDERQPLLMYTRQNTPRRQDHLTRSAASRQLRVTARVLDSCPEWHEVADMVLRTYQSNRQHGVCYLRHDDLIYDRADFSDPHFVDQNLRDIRKADLVTMVKAVSAMAGSGSRREMALRSLKSIFNNMKPGALAVFMDNAGGGLTKMVKRAGKDCGMQKLYRTEHRKSYIRTKQNLAHLEPYRTLLSKAPQSGTCVSVIIWRKPDHQVHPSNVTLKFR